MLLILAALACSFACFSYWVEGITVVGFYKNHAHFRTIQGVYASMILLGHITTPVLVFNLLDKLVFSPVSKSFEAIRKNSQPAVRFRRRVKKLGLSLADVEYAISLQMKNNPHWNWDDKDFFDKACNSFITEVKRQSLNVAKVYKGHSSEKIHNITLQIAIERFEEETKVPSEFASA